MLGRRAAPLYSCKRINYRQSQLCKVIGIASPSGQDPFLSARRAVFPSAPEREHASEWNILQKIKPFATDLLLSPERIRYMQQLNIDFNVQKTMLPLDQVVDMSLARDALKLIDST